MIIELKQNKKLNLDIPEFVCDNNPLGEHLNKYDMLLHLNSYSFTAIIGKPGSRKTSLLVSFLTGRGKKKVFRKVFNNVFLVMPPSARNSMKSNPFKKHPAEKIFDELTLETIQTIYDRLLESSENKENTLLVLDDIGATILYNIQ